MHVPVMLQETVDCLAVRPGGVYLDATLGEAGHAVEILRRAAPGGRLLGIDRDPAAIDRASARLREAAPGCAVCVQGNHADLGTLADAHGFSGLDGVVIDTGVSSWQLDEAARGFSFQQDGALDMRMDPTRGETAAELLARLDAVGLATCFRTLGEEPQAMRVARAIIRERERAPIMTTLHLAEVVTHALGGRGDRKRHPATRVFQALRMAVNGELDALAAALEAAMERLRPGGRLAVITFESLSDRLVKRCFAEHVGRDVALQQGGSHWEGRLPRMDWVARRALRPGEEEVRRNPRARSAKLRAVVRPAAGDGPLFETGRQDRARRTIPQGNVLNEDR
jgi:16S rRNA (cytosine1402-N4)-methyltransferase